ncbi:MAG TPA: hypothetical protein VNY82_13955 [Steroidobacteraceae bacterium]|nr:hypothetical protein [Steroidobacteraceae bacterium]
MTLLDTSLQAQVDAQLLEQGAFAPLELLFNSGRLLYSDYESWRRREIEFLDGVLMGNPDKIKAELEQAAGYARRIKLVEQAQEFHAWHQAAPEAAGGGDRPLRISMDPQLQRLIGSRYVRAQSVPQLDLFFDNPVVALANGIVQALTTHNLMSAQRQLDQLYTQAPTHSELAAFDQLLAALGHLAHPVAEPRAELAFLLEVTPTARRLLGAQSRDLLSPLWMQLGDAVRGSAFDTDEPALHRSFALSQAQDWAGVTDSVLSEPGWQRHAPLCLRLVESAFNRRQRVAALAAWCHVCWRAPAETSQAVSKLRQPELTTLWQRFLDDEPDAQTAGESALTEIDFPAWLLLSEPGLALQLAEELATGTPAEEPYRCVHRWIHARRARQQSEELALRKSLQASHPALFRVLKRSV